MLHHAAPPSIIISPTPALTRQGSQSTSKVLLASKVSKHSACLIVSLARVLLLYQRWFKSKDSEQPRSLNRRKRDWQIIKYSQLELWRLYKSIAELIRYRLFMLVPIFHFSSMPRYSSLSFTSSSGRGGLQARLVWGLPLVLRPRTSGIIQWNFSNAKWCKPCHAV